MAPMGDRGAAYGVFFVGRPVGKRPLGKSTRGWEDNIKNGSSRSIMGRHRLY